MHAHPFAEGRSRKLHGGDFAAARLEGANHHLVGALKARGVEVIPPVSKKLACGDTGVGAMAEVEDIVEAAVGKLRAHAEAEAAALADGKPPFVP